MITPHLKLNEGDHFWIKIDGEQLSLAVTESDSDSPNKLKWVDLFTSDIFTSEETVVPFIYFADDDGDKVRVHPAP